MSFQELNSCTPGARGVESLTLKLWENDANWEFIKKITCEFYPWFYPHKQVFLGFWIAKAHELPGAAKGMESQWTVHSMHGMRIYCEITSNQN